MKKPSNDDGSESMQRLQAMLLPDSYASKELELRTRSLTLAYGLDGRPVGMNPFHLSLVNWGKFRSVPERVKQDAGETCLHFASETPPFEVMLNQAMSFSGNETGSALVMCTDQNNRILLDLFRDLLARPEEKDVNLTPHVTLLYDKRLIAKRPIDPVSWVAKEIVLVVSHLRKSHYEVIGRFPFWG